jgi:hypothetical protein
VWALRTRTLRCHERVVEGQPTILRRGQLCAKPLANKRLVPLVFVGHRPRRHDDHKLGKQLRGVGAAGGQGRRHGRHDVRRTPVRRGRLCSSADRMSSAMDRTYANRTARRLFASVVCSGARNELLQRLSECEAEPQC